MLAPLAVAAVVGVAPRARARATGFARGAALASRRRARWPRARWRWASRRAGTSRAGARARRSCWSLTLAGARRAAGGACRGWPRAARHPVALAVLRPRARARRHGRPTRTSCRGSTRRSTWPCSSPACSAPRSRRSPRAPGRPRRGGRPPGGRGAVGLLVVGLRRRGRRAPRGASSAPANLRIVLVEHAPLMGRAVTLAMALRPPAPRPTDAAPGAAARAAPGEVARSLDWTGHDLVLISVDALRADHVSAYGYARPTTPEPRRAGRRGHALRARVLPDAAHVVLGDVDDDGQVPAAAPGARPRRGLGDVGAAPAPLRLAHGRVLSARGVLHRRGPLHALRGRAPRLRVREGGVRRSGAARAAGRRVSSTPRRPTGRSFSGCTSSSRTSPTSCTPSTSSPAARRPTSTPTTARSPPPTTASAASCALVRGAPPGRGRRRDRRPRRGVRRARRPLPRHDGLRGAGARAARRRRARGARGAAGRRRSCRRSTCCRRRSRRSASRARRGCAGATSGRCSPARRRRRSTTGARSSRPTTTSSWRPDPIGSSASAARRRARSTARRTTRSSGATVSADDPARFDAHARAAARGRRATTAATRP